MPDYGIQPHYVDALGARHHATRQTIAAIRRAISGAVERTRSGAGSPQEVLVVRAGERRRLGPADLRLEDGTEITIGSVLPRDLPPGYHQLVRRRRPPQRLFVAPAGCYLPEHYRTWGWAIQLYAARSRRSWGIGDLADLRWLGRWAKRDGAGLSLISPLAAAAPLAAQQPSPYFPSSRRFRNPLHLRIEEVPGATAVSDLAPLARRGRALNGDRRIDRDEIYSLKIQALEGIWNAVRAHRDRGFETFLTAQGEPLRQYATFCALAERFATGWQGWPSKYRHPLNPAVQQASKDAGTRDRIRFHQWLQYQLDRQLARASGVLPVMQDLPIGFDPGGADAWAFQDVLADGMSVGAPPDQFNTRGQDWGLPPFVPQALRMVGYEPFVQTIRACLRHAGGLRIDHVMGLFRLFWIPSGMEPSAGAYVRSLSSDLLGILAIESQRAGAVIVGEDLGTVEEQTRAELASRRILSYCLMWFDKGPPALYPEQALAAVTTHDLPTVAGLWTGSDVDEQKRLNLAPNEAGTREIHARVQRMVKGTGRTPVRTVIARLYAALAAAPSRVLTATLEDAMAVTDRPNMPATAKERPNWSLALPQPIESLAGNPLVRRLARALARRGDYRAVRRRRTAPSGS